VCVVRVLVPFFLLNTNIGSSPACSRKKKRKKKWKCQLSRNTTKGEPVHVEGQHSPYS
jgi:hypothetical protein